jgi:DNA polymerase-3 subunit delta'
VKLGEIVGHEPAVARLRRAAGGERPAAAYLLLGPPGVGKRTLARAFTARLLCAMPDDEDACGTCPQCVRLASGTHPDLRLVTREDERRDIRTEQVRELARWLALKPLMAARKVARVDEAQCLNEHGQNALLKVLEEPPGASVLILCTSEASQLLPTVRSRCQRIRLAPLPEAAVVRVLTAQGLAPDQARTLAARAEGSPGLALARGGEAEAGVRDTVLATLPKLGQLGAAELSRAAQELARAGSETVLGTVASWYRDVLEAGLSSDLALRNREAAAAVRAAAARTPTSVVLRQLATVCDTILALERNANRVLALETMLLSLRSLERGEAAELCDG